MNLGVNSAALAKLDMKNLKALYAAMLKVINLPAVNAQTKADFAAVKAELMKRYMKVGLWIGGGFAGFLILVKLMKRKRRK